jgi:uncharacterized membrane protein
VTASDRGRVAQAIARAEEGTTGRIAVRIVPHKQLEAFEHAKREFGQTGLHLHEHENAALVLVAPKARQFAVLGDRALHERVGDAFWNRIVDEMQPYFRRNAIADGIVHAVDELGVVLHEHFPAGREEEA